MHALPSRPPRPRLISVLASLLGLALLAACHRGPQSPRTEQAPGPAPTLTAKQYPGALRRYYRLPVDDPGRDTLRRSLLNYLAAVGQSLVEAEDYDASVEHLATVTSLYLPSELEQHPPESLQGIAEFLKRRGERAGDEARVLSALWLMLSLHRDDPQYASYYRELRTWSEEARADYGMLTESIDGLIEVLEEHARLTPAPGVLDDLADRYLERRRELVALLGPHAQRPPDPDSLSYQIYREATYYLSRAPFDVAAVYLLHDDPGGALARLRTMENVTGREPRMRSWLEVVSDGGPDAADATLLLALSYIDVERPDVAVALCRRGMRMSPENARFPQCLGRLAAGVDDYVEATYDYAEAVRLAPDDRALYDEALEVLANMLRDGLFAADPTETRTLAGQAEEILRARMDRWPDAAPPVALEDLELAVGMAEMSAGNTDEARRRFESSLALSETVRALVQLGTLEARLDQLDAAAKHLHRALELTPERSLDQAGQRAQVLESLADVMRATDEQQQAQSYYAEALKLWDAAVQASKDRAAISAMQTRRGVLLERLGKEEESVQAFELAIEAAPDDRETYAQILSHMVVGVPAPSLASSILRRAQRQLTLDPEWKTYFALWVQTISARAQEPLSADVNALLQRLSRSDAWWGKLAKFGRGEIDYKALREAAETRGEQTEADFYEGARLMAKGDREGANGLFKQVLDTHMVSFYEYQMALELLRD